MAKNCGHTVPCGCKDTALTTAPPCETTGPCAGEQCVEVFCDECIAHCKQDLIVEIADQELEVDKGTRLNEIWQRLAIAISSPECAVKSAVGLCITDVTSTSITIAWLPGTASQYQIAYDSPTCPSQGTSIELSNSVTTYTVTGLLPGEEYILNIIPIGYESCPSIKIKTKTLEP